MPAKEYPEHDINLVFDRIQETISAGNVADNALDEMSFLNRLFAALPVDAVEYGMQFLHGKRDLPKTCEEILPLYIRFTNLVEYCEIIEDLKVIPKNPTPEELTSRIRMNGQLDELEKAFCKPLLGFAYNKEMPSEKIDPENIRKDGTRNEEEGSNLHLMESVAPVFACRDPLETAAFYEDKLGFRAAHLDDESMPHIRLSRDNIEIILVKAGPEEIKKQKDGLLHPSSRYSFYVFVSEPMMLQMELQSAGVKLVKTLEESDTIHTNREFVFEDCDGRRICVSQKI